MSSATGHGAPLFSSSGSRTVGTTTTAPSSSKISGRGPTIFFEGVFSNASWRTPCRSCRNTIGLVFQLRELEGKSYEEISEITGVNLGTVKSRLHRARNSFAQRIEPFLN